MIHIMVVEDDAKLNKIACQALNASGYAAIGCAGAMEAFDAMVDNMVDLIVSDIMMPKMDGYEFAQLVREQNKEIPILFMTARDDISSKQKGYQLGIDDYVTKPVDMDELIMRVGALLRRANNKTEKKLIVGGLVLDTDETAAYVNNEQVPLTVKEFNILFKLLSYPKRTFTRTQLMDEFWGIDASSTPRTVDVYIAKLRDMFASCADFEIVTVHGLGYKAVLK